MQLEVYDASCNELIVKGVVKDVDFDLTRSNLCRIYIRGAGYASCYGSEECKCSYDVPEGYTDQHQYKTKITF